MEVVKNSIKENSEIANTKSETEFFDDNASDKEVDPTQKMLSDSPITSAAGDVAILTPVKKKDETARKIKRKKRSTVKR